MKILILYLISLNKFELKMALDDFETLSVAQFFISANVKFVPDLYFVKFRAIRIKIKPAKNREGIRSSILDLI